MEKEIQTPMAQGPSTKIIQKMWWIRTSRLSIKHYLYSLLGSAADLSKEFGVCHELSDPGVLRKVRVDECLAQGLGSNVQRFQRRLVFKADGLLYHSNLGLREIKKRRRRFRVMGL